MYVLCGLGNPGEQFKNTRHNMGFRTMDLLSERLNIEINKLKFKALIGVGQIGGEQVMLVKPQTFMNNSGECLREIVNFYKLPMDHLMVVYDDVDLAVGDLRLRAFGSSGTHNGMRSIIYQLQKDDFPRARVGVGYSKIIPLDKWVLGTPDDADEKLISEAIDKAASACEVFVTKGIAAAQQEFNHKNKHDNKTQRDI